MDITKSYFLDRNVHVSWRDDAMAEMVVTSNRCNLQDKKSAESAGPLLGWPNFDPWCCPRPRESIFTPRVQGPWFFAKN